MQGDTTVHDLKCTIVVAQEGSLSRAATRLHMTQPALAAESTTLNARSV